MCNAPNASFVISRIYLRRSGMDGWTIRKPDNTIYIDCADHLICAPTAHDAWMAYVGPHREYMIDALYREGYLPVEIKIEAK